MKGNKRRLRAQVAELELRVRELESALPSLGRCAITLHFTDGTDRTIWQDYRGRLVNHHFRFMMLKSQTVEQISWKLKETGQPIKGGYHDPVGCYLPRYVDSGNTMTVVQKFDPVLRFV